LSSSDPTRVVTQRWRLDLAYDGRAFSGFAYQPECTTVVGVLRETLASTLHMGEEPLIVGAGRTDTGVHAFAQVVHVDLPVTLFAKNRGPDPERLMSSINKQLRGRIQVVAARRVSDDFHARHSALWREYRYLVLESEPPALELTNRWSWAVRGPLDLAAMDAAGRDLVGTHDFRAFCRRSTNGSADDPIVRKVLAVTFERLEDQWSMSPTGAAVVRIDIRAQSFCHNMVRCLTSTLVSIGQGSLAQSTVKERLESLERNFLPAPAPAQGLSLTGVGYGELAGGPSGFVR
jgi:tRNA pseudouridine38-40 synthase